jgi:hypothetical protein
VVKDKEDEKITAEVEIVAKEGFWHMTNLVKELHIYFREVVHPVIKILGSSSLSLTYSPDSDDQPQSHCQGGPLKPNIDVE